MNDTTGAYRWIDECARACCIERKSRFLEHTDLIRAYIFFILTLVGLHPSASNAQNFDGWCFPENACMGSTIPIENNAYESCESTCTLANPVKVRGLEATLFDVVCKGDWGSSRERMFLSKITNVHGKTKVVVISQTEATELQRCR
jgi:hypothetical protein